MVMSRHQNAGKNRDKSFENTANFRYFGKAVTNQNCIQVEIKSRLNMGNPCNHFVQNLLSYRLLSKNLKFKIYKAIILPVVCMGSKPGLSH